MATKKNTAAPAKKQVPENTETLLGSSIQPATFETYDGKTIQLGTVVAEAQKRSNLTVDAWNALPDDEREELIAGVVAEIPLEAPADPSENESEANAPKEPEEDNNAPLTGSTVQPATFTLNTGETVTVEQVVEAAFVRSNLSVSAWNKLADDEREAHIAGVVAGLALETPPAAPVVDPNKPKKAAPKGKLVRLRVLSAHHINSQDIAPNDVLTCSQDVAKQLVDAGIANDAPEEVEYALSQEGVKEITLDE